MHIRRPPSGDGPKIYRPNESVATMRLEPQARPVAYEPDSIPPPPRDSLLTKVNRRRGAILTFMVSFAAIASFGASGVVGAQPGRPGGRQGAGAPGRPGADHADPGEARECRRPDPARPGQGSLQPDRPRRRADPAREAAAGPDDAQAAAGRHAAADRAQGAGSEQDPDADPDRQRDSAGHRRSTPRLRHDADSAAQRADRDPGAHHHAAGQRGRHVTSPA